MILPRPRWTVPRELGQLANLWIGGRQVRGAARALALAALAAVAGAALPFVAQAQDGTPDPAHPTEGGAGALDAILGGGTGALVFGLLYLATVLAKRSNGNHSPQRKPDPPQVEIDWPDPTWTSEEKIEAQKLLRDNEKRVEDLHKWLDPEGGRIQDNIREIRSAVVKSGTND